MGMAASQARFLTLTARKSNTEYQGQQVNQQRTALANESANIYNKLANMEVPTAPSKTAYNRNIYSFKGSNGEKYSITNITNIDKEDPSKVLVKIEYNELTDIAQKYTLGGLTGESVLAHGKDITVGNKGNTKTYSVQDCAASKGNIAVPAEIASKYTDGVDENGNAKEGYWFQLREKNAEGELSEKGRFIHISELSKKDEAGKALPAEYCVIETTSMPTSKEVEATLDTNDSGRHTHVTLNSGNELGFNDRISLSYEYGTDEDAYEKAMADYEFKKAQYDKEVDVLNNKTEIIQNQDKRLELKLKQLDTERQALDTEMEAVKGYLKKNVEGTFNTFG